MLPIEHMRCDGIEEGWELDGYVEIGKWQRKVEMAAKKIAQDGEVCKLNIPTMNEVSIFLMLLELPTFACSSS